MIIDALLVVILAGVAYVVNIASGLYPGDAGDLVTAAVTGGIPHPPGYPLYTALGWMVTRLHVGTPAWQMAWLSVLPHLLTLGFVYFLTYKLTKHRLASWFAAFMLAGNYLFFLYSVTPEVFALLDAFVVILLYEAYLLTERFSFRTFTIFCFTLGLSLTHHPFIIFLFPSLLFLVYPLRRKLFATWRRVAWAVGAFVLGLSPYLYVPFAARGNSIINWDRPTTFTRFIQLITRADYGSFMSGSTISQGITDRFINVQGFWIFLVVDYTWVGILLALCGCIYLWKTKKRAAIAIAVGILFLGPVFSFYASFPTVNRFVLGTVERFSLPTYVLLAPLTGIGAYALCGWVSEAFRFVFREKKKLRQLAGLLFGVLCLVPLVIGGMNLWRFHGIAGDRTNDTFVKDLLDSAPQNSILILSRDTPIFGAQYMRYARSYRPDTIVLHASRLPAPDYHEVLARAFPRSLFLPNNSIQGVAYMDAFMVGNYPAHQIVVNVPLPVGSDWVWVPHGLLYVLTPADKLPANADVIAENQALWQSYHDPYAGLLSRYKHLLLTSPLDDYAISAISYGKYLMKLTRLNEAVGVFKRAVSYGSDTQTSSAWMYMGLAYSLDKDCQAAISAYGNAEHQNLSPDPSVLYLEGITYRDCVGNQQKANEYFSRYQQSNRQSQMPLEGAPQTQ